MRTSPGYILRRLLPVVLLVVGVSGLTGCIIIPTFGVRISGRDFSDQVGRDGTNKHIIVSRSTRDDVLKKLGPPQYASEHGREIAYAWSRLDAIYFGLCTGSDKEHFALILRFDSNLILVDFEITRAFYRTSFRSTPEGPKLQAEMRAVPPNWRPPPANPAEAAPNTRPAEGTTP